MSALVALVRLLRALSTDPAHFWIAGGMVILGDALLTQMIIRFISCQCFALTEEDGLINAQCRHRDRLGDIYDPYPAIPERGARLQTYHRPYRSSGVSEEQPPRCQHSSYGLQVPCRARPHFSPSI